MPTSFHAIFCFSCILKKITSHNSYLNSSPFKQNLFLGSKPAEQMAMIEYNWLKCPICMFAYRFGEVDAFAVIPLWIGTNTNSTIYISNTFLDNYRLLVEIFGGSFRLNAYQSLVLPLALCVVLWYSFIFTSSFLSNVSYWDIVITYVARISVFETFVVPQWGVSLH